MNFLKISQAFFWKCSLLSRLHTFVLYFVLYCIVLYLFCILFFTLKRGDFQLMILLSVYVCVLVSRPDDDPSLGVETSCHINKTIYNWLDCACECLWVWYKCWCWWTVCEVDLGRKDRHKWIIQANRCQKISKTISRRLLTLGTACDDDEIGIILHIWTLYIWSRCIKHYASRCTSLLAWWISFRLTWHAKYRINLSSGPSVHRHKATCILYLRGMPSWRRNFKENLFCFQNNTLAKETCK